MVISSVVRLGPSEDNVSAKVLRTAVVSFFDKLNSEAKQSTGDDNNESSAITISNKYFNAKVLLEEIGGSTVAEGGSKEDGVILVFDALKSNPDLATSSSSAGATFDSLSVAHSKAEDCNTCGDLLRLCVGVSLAEHSPEEIRGKNQEKEYSRRIMWCLDHGYEYVEADLSQEGQSKGHNERDKEGFARIIEAIQGIVWSSAVMSKPKQQELKQTYKEDLSAIEKKEEADDEAENPYIPPDPTKLPPIPTKDDNEVQEKIMSKESNAEAGLLLDPENVSSKDIEQLRNDLDAENLFDQMEGVLREASRIREASKTGTLTDDERRNRAGDAAMALVNLMGQLGVEEDDSIVDDSDDSSGIAED